jgi:RNA polymerase sigma-70 factor (ECF subfamily)
VLNAGETVQTDLVIRASHGDEDAFAELAGAAIDRLYAVAQRILRDTGAAEDAVQRALMSAWRELPRLRDPERFDAWTYRLLVNACHRELRDRRTNRANVLTLVHEPAAPDSSGQISDRDELERAFRHLTPDQRSILVLHHYLGYEPIEIAATLDIPSGTARSRLHYAQKSLRAALEADARAAALAGRPA